MGWGDAVIIVRLHTIFELLIFFLVSIKLQSFLFSLKWIPINIIINVTIVICKINHPIPMKIFKIHRNMLCIHHYPIPVKILKIHHSMFVSTTPTHVVYEYFTLEIYQLIIS